MTYHRDMILHTHTNEHYKAIDFINFKTTKHYKIVVHLRLEDFIDISLVIDPTCILPVIDKINKEYNNEIICIVLNKPTTELEFKYINFFTEKYPNIVVESNDVITDYTIMKESTILVCSCSTLSWAAAILSNSIQKVYMPDYKNVHGPHQTCKRPILNTELYEINICSSDELRNILGIVKYIPEKSYSLVDNMKIPLDIKLDKLFNSKRDGIYIELGAFDGLYQSNTAFLNFIETGLDY
jgi:hypothetical protein